MFYTDAALSFMKGSMSQKELAEFFAKTPAAKLIYPPGEVRGYGEMQYDGDERNTWAAVEGVMLAHNVPDKIRSEIEAAYKSSL